MYVCVWMPCRNARTTKNYFQFFSISFFFCYFHFQNRFDYGRNRTDVNVCCVWVQWIIEQIHAQPSYKCMHMCVCIFRLLPNSNSWIHCHTDTLSRIRTYVHWYLSFGDTHSRSSLACSLTQTHTHTQKHPLALNNRLMCPLIVMANEWMTNTRKVEGSKT